MSQLTDAPFDLVDYFIRLDNGELTEDETLTLFAYLVKTGMAWTLQGRIGRQAAFLIDADLISPQGEVL